MLGKEVWGEIGAPVHHDSNEGKLEYFNVHYKQICALDLKETVWERSTHRCQMSTNLWPCSELFTFVRMTLKLFQFTVDYNSYGFCVTRDWTQSSFPDYTILIPVPPVQHSYISLLTYRILKITV